MNLRAIVLVLAFVIIGLTAFAETPSPSFTITSAETGVFTVFYQRPEAGKVKLSIYDKQNVLVFKEILSTTGSFKRPYNFSELAKGEYTIVLEDKNGRQEEKVNYQSHSPLSFIKVSKAADQKDKYVLNVVTTGSEVVSVKIFDSLKGMIHEKEITVDGSLGLLYNLSQVKSSDSAVVIFEVTTANGQTVTAMF
jgi:hypothetical protein